MKFFKKQTETHDRILEHLDKCLACHEMFIRRVSEIISEEKGEKALGYAMEVSRLETEADAVRRRIIAGLLKGDLLPQSRREILELIEKNDDIANESEEIIREMVLQGVVIEPRYARILNKINEETSRQLEKLRMAVDKIFTGIWSEEESFRSLCIDIDAYESAVDAMEQSLVKEVYQSGLSLAEKNQLRFFVTKFADVSDLAEDISDLLEEIMIIRKV